MNEDNVNTLWEKFIPAHFRSEEMSMLLDIQSLKIVIIDSPYDCLGMAGVPELFGKMAALKIKGYREEHPYGALPLDATDFIGTHLLVCHRSGESWAPIMGYKSVTLERCSAHNLSFPALTLVQSSAAPRHAQVVRQLLSDAGQKKIDISYDSSWTIHPEVRKNRELTRELKNLMTAMSVLHHRDYGIPEIIGCGVVQLKTERFFMKMGYLPLNENGTILPAFPQSSLLGAEVLMMHLNEFSVEAKETAQRFQSLWDARIYFGARVVADVASAA